MLTNKMISLQNKKSSSLTSSKSSIGSKSNELSLQPVSVLINANDIQILKNEKGHDEVLGVGNFGIVKEAVWNSHNGSKVKNNSRLYLDLFITYQIVIVVFFPIIYIIFIYNQFILYSINRLLLDESIISDQSSLAVKEFNKIIEKSPSFTLYPIVFPDRTHISST